MESTNCPPSLSGEKIGMLPCFVIRTAKKPEGERGGKFALYFSFERYAPNFVNPLCNFVSSRLLKKEDRKKREGGTYQRS